MNSIVCLRSRLHLSLGLHVTIRMIFTFLKLEREECITTAEDENTVVNPNFEDGLNNWSGRNCKIVLHDSMADGKIVPEYGKVFAAATERTQNWNGIQQEITGTVQRKRVYVVTAVVCIYGNNVTNATVRSTLWVQNPNQRDQYIGISGLVFFLKSYSIRPRIICKMLKWIFCFFFGT